MKQFQILSLTLMLLTIIGCSDEVTPSNFTGTTQEIREMLRGENPEQVYLVSTDGFEIKTNYGTVISAAPNSFTYLDGSPYTGDFFTLGVTEVISKSDLIRYGYQTITTNGEILTSDGEYNFTAMADRELMLTPQATLELYIPNENPSNSAILFDLSSETMTWTPRDTTPLQLGEWRFEMDDWQFGYVASLSSLDWVNVDYFTKFELPLTEVQVCLPQGYSLENTLAFAVFSDRDIVLELGESVDNLFMAPLPLGENVHLVAITSEGGGNFRVVKKEVTITENLKVNLEPQPASEEEIIACLESLD